MVLVRQFEQRRNFHQNLGDLRFRHSLEPLPKIPNMANQSLKLIEYPRDAWQGLPGQIPTELKVQYLRALVSAGFKHIDAVSFVSPNAVPQIVDSATSLEPLEAPNHLD